MSDYQYWQSGATGWAQITDPKIPNPNAVPIRTPNKSTRRRDTLATGAYCYITPEVKSVNDPVTFTWQYQSGAGLIVQTFEDVKDNDYFFRIISNVPGEQWTGKLNSVNDEKYLKGEEDYRDIVIELEQISDE